MGWYSKTRRFRRYCFIGLLSCSLTMAFGVWSGDMALAEAQPVRLAQLFLPGSSGLETQPLPAEVRKVGGAEIAPVYFQGDLVFEVASPAVLDRDNLGDTLPVEIRANRIENDLDYVVSFANPNLISDERDYRTVYDPESFSAQVNILNGQRVITASDDYRHSPQVLATVTDTDAEYYGLSQEDLAELWRDRIQTVLQETLLRRSPRALKAWVLMAVSLLTGLVALGVGAWILHRRLSSTKRQLDQQMATMVAEAEQVIVESPESQSPTTAVGTDSGESVVDPRLRAEQRLTLLNRIKQSTDLDEKIALLNFFRWLLVWAQVLAWVVAITFLISRYPLAQITAWEVLLKPQLILLVWFMAGLGNRLLKVLITRASALGQASADYSSEEMQRRRLRITTTVNVINGLKTVIIYLVALFFTLDILGLNTNSLLAVSALLGLAISLAAQNVIKDLVNGFLVLLEDQYAIGDVIEIDEDTSGLVENLNLRVTQLRDLEGRLITLPNSQIGRVVNLTRLWARVDESVFVDASTNVNQALAVVQATVDSLYADPQLKEVILAPPEVLGIETMTHAGIEIRTLIKTKPAQQWTVARAFRLRLKTALDEKGIAFGRPQREVWHHSAGWEE